MKILITGGRDFADQAMVDANLSFIHDHVGIDLLIEGGATGADRLAQNWAKQTGVPLHTVPADWQRFGRRAGPQRNRDMAGLMPDKLLAFPGGRGTADMRKVCEERGIPVMDAVTPRQLQMVWE